MTTSTSTTNHLLKSYKTKKEITETLRAIIATYQTISRYQPNRLPINSADYQFVMWVLRHHAEWSWWESQEPTGLWVGNAMGGTFCFYVDFANPIEKRYADISWRKCLNNLTKTDIIELNDFIKTI